MIYEFTIPLVPVTKKNHQRILINKATGKPFVSTSLQYKQYEEGALWFVPHEPGKTIDYRVNIECRFYMPTRRRVDLTNLLESIDDIMVKAGLLEDDDSNVIAGHDGSRVLYDKEHPRTEVRITKMEDET